MTVIESADYENTRQRLMKDPIVITMAEEIATLASGVRTEMVHEGGNPKSDFMMAANKEYRKRGGTDGGHIGAIAEAIFRLVDSK